MATSERQIDHHYSLKLVRILERLGGSLLLSSFSADKLITVAAVSGKLEMTFHNVERPMGIARYPQGLAVSARRQVWFFQSTPALVPQIGGGYDHCFLARSSHLTGDVHTHELLYCNQQLWLVNTLFSCLCTIAEHSSFVPRWRPEWISSLSPDDRCHLNGVATRARNGGPDYVTVFAPSDALQGWRDLPSDQGQLIRVSNRTPIADGLRMPHSPRYHNGFVYLLESAAGRLLRLDPNTGQGTTIARLRGYPRGLAIVGGLAFIGYSKLRETAALEQMPIAAQKDAMHCGLSVIDLDDGAQLAWLEFVSGIDELFDVQFIANCRQPFLQGPYPELDQQDTVWWSEPTKNQS